MIFTFAQVQIFQDKPETVANIPESMLPPDKKEKYRNTTGLAIVEIAGRDSVAAAVKSVMEEGFTDLLPVYAYTGTEHGPWSSVEKAVERLEKRLPEVRVHDLMVLGSPEFWKALNGRFVSELISEFGFYSPCVGCHMYLHAVRIPLAVDLGMKPIVSGERESHDGGIKINQYSDALDRYEALAAKFGIRLTFPLRRTDRGDEVEELLQSRWKQGGEQLGCVLSGNYKQKDGATNIDPNRVATFLDAFAAPCAEKIIADYLDGRIPDHIAIATDILNRNGK